MSGWGPALRIARRELLRAKGRSLLVLVMVLLPVTAVVALSTLLHTSEVDAVEGLPTTLGTASARLDVSAGVVQQSPDLLSTGQLAVERGRGGERADAARLAELLPAGTRLLEVRETYDSRRLVAGDRGLRVSRVGVDLRDESLRGPFVVRAGRPPAGPDEVAVTPRLQERGVAVGDRVELLGEPRTVTGVVQPPRDSDPSTVYGLPEAVGLADTPVVRYYATGPGVSWPDVLALNGAGLYVLSRDVLLDPPPADQVPFDDGYLDEREVLIATVALIAVMAVLEVVLLAGPAFAVGARRQRRSLALMAAGGAEPRQVRRVVLAQGVVVGGTAAVVGVPLGLAVAALARGPLEVRSGSAWGPYEVALGEVLLVAVLGAGTALLAALLPALVMARQPVVAALQGRRLTSAGAARPAAGGLVLIVLGLALTAVALQSPGRVGGYAELGVAAGAVPLVLGTVLLAPAALRLVGRCAGRLPLPLRFAARDADRQRGRTAPAVAAIAATVAGVVALATAAGSDGRQDRQEYRPSGPLGVAAVSAYGTPDVDYDALAGAARRALPGEPVAEVTGLPAPVFGGPGGAYTEVQVCRASESPTDGRCVELLGNYGSGFGSDLLVGPAGLQALAGTLPDGELERARSALAAGEALLTGPSVVAGEPVELRLTRFEVDPASGQERTTVLASARATAARLDGGSPAMVRAVLPTEVADDLGEVQVVGLLVGDDLTLAQEERLQAAVGRADEVATVRVERGFEPRADRTALLLLSLAAGVLVLAGTLAATALALSEARPDLTTLGQVGARPRTRRLVAGGYALVLGVVGAVLGTAAGLVPGLAVAVPLTRSSASYSPLGDEPVGPASSVQVPWLLLLLLLVGLPLLSAAVAAATARSGRPVTPRRRLA